MTTLLTTRSLLASFAVATAIMLLWSGQAQAQSEVTGTLTSGTAATGSTATGTISGGSGNSISGTVVSPAQCQDGIDNDNDGEIDYPADDGCESLTDDQEEQESGGGGGGGGSRRSSSNNDDDGEVLGADTSDGVGGGSDVFTPGVPNTGEGANALSNLLTLLMSLSVAGAGAWSMRYKH